MKNLGSPFALLAAFVAGGALVWWWDYTHLAQRMADTQAIFAQNQQAKVAQVDLREAQLAEGVEEAEPAPTVRRGSELPSQLTPIELAGVSEVYAVSKPQEEQPAPPAEKAPVVLDEPAGKVPAATDNARAAMPTQITMLEAPVSARVIADAEDYKAFKREARGSYPAADFDTEQVVVLESQSNLPDKVFEVVEVVPQADKIILRYRVNIFGLDEKTNTHSATKMAKTPLPLALEQVL